MTRASWTSATLGVIATVFLGFAQVPPGTAEPEMIARAIRTTTSVCQEDEDIGRLRFDVSVELRSVSQAPLLIYKMADQWANGADIAKSREDASRKQFFISQWGSVYLGDDDFVKEITQDSFTLLRPGETLPIRLQAQIFVPLPPRADQFRSGNYWFSTTVRTWPYTRIRADSLEFSERIWTKELTLEPTEFSVTIPANLQSCN